MSQDDPRAAARRIVEQTLAEHARAAQDELLFAGTDVPATAPPATDPGQPVDAPAGPDRAGTDAPLFADRLASAAGTTTRAASDSPAAGPTETSVLAAPAVAPDAAAAVPETAARRRARELVASVLEEAEAREQAEKEAEQARRQEERAAAARAAQEAAAREAEEARRAAEQEARRQAEEEAARRAEQEARRQAEEEAARQAEQEAARQAEEEAARQAEEQRWLDEQARAEPDVAPAPAPTLVTPSPGHGAFDAAGTTQQLGPGPVDEQTTVLHRPDQENSGVLEATVDLPETMPERRPRVARWLVASILGAVALAVLFPLAVQALRTLVRLS